MPSFQRLSMALAVLVCFPTPGLTAPPDGAPKPIPILLDTDIGTDIDDAFALGLILASPEVELHGVTTVGDQAEDRAWLVCRFLTLCGRTGVPVAVGVSPQPDTKIEEQIQYRRHPAAIFNRTLKPVKQPAAELLYEQLKQRPGELTIVAIGPLTNIARLFKEHPDSVKLIERIVLMGGSARIGYSGKPPAEPEWNIKLDASSARAVFMSGVPLTVVPLDATATVQLNKESREKLFASRTPQTFQIQNLYELWAIAPDQNGAGGRETPTLFDPVAVACVFNESFCKFEDLNLAVEENGLTRVDSDKSNARVAVSVDAGKFAAWIVDRLSKVGQPSLPKPPGNRTRLVDRGGFPRRVHVAEDYDSDIERRWWMSGKAETVDLPAGSLRACRGVLTQDFDDLQGDLKTTYRAVIFNPVPGPPMGPKTRLAFRYKLKGTDTLRVQLYTLSKGYHRCLSISELVQNQWQRATVDMTELRRPDGSGGPLSEGERIDDIQFYVDPRAELLIDDVVLYDAADAAEREPFPARVMFTGWFDTGKQGEEWPGTFAIETPKTPYAGKCAKSVLNDKLGQPWIRLGLRGERRLSAKTELRFAAMLHGADGLRVELRRGGQVLPGGVQDVAAKRNAWEKLSATFNAPADEKAERIVDEIWFLVPPGGELRIDDLLLFEPGT